jgi:hypothetical protein
VEVGQEEVMTVKILEDLQEMEILILEEMEVDQEEVMIIKILEDLQETKILDQVQEVQILYHIKNLLLLNKEDQKLQLIIQ